MGIGDILGALQSLKANPMAFLIQRKFNIPPEISNDPNKIINYLVSTGQVSQEQYNYAYQQAMTYKNANR